MLVIDSIQYSKNPVKVGEAFLISVSISEEVGTWNDTVNKTWGNIGSNTWNQVNTKYFNDITTYSDLAANETWQTLQVKTWDEIK